MAVPPGRTIGLSWVFLRVGLEALELTQGQVWLRTEILGCSESVRVQVSSAWVQLKAEAAHHPGALSAGDILATPPISPQEMGSSVRAPGTAHVVD